MFELILHTGSTSNQGAILEILDASNWITSTLGSRDKYGLYVKGIYHMSSTPEDVIMPTDTPQTDGSWLVNMVQGDGRYKFSMYAFPTIASYAGSMSTGDLGYDAVPLGLKKYNGSTWDAVLEEDNLGDAKYSTILDIPYVANAFIYKNVLNLEYIVQVKGDITQGVDQNTLYYKRTDLDYFNALLDGAGYNFSMSLWSNFYDIIANLDDIRINRQIS